MQCAARATPPFNLKQFESGRVWFHGFAQAQESTLEILDALLSMSIWG